VRGNGALELQQVLNNTRAPVGVWVRREQLLHGNQFASPIESKPVQVSGNVVTEHRQDRAHLIQPFPHPIPLDLKSVSVVDDVSEAAEGTQLLRQRIVELDRDFGLEFFGRHKSTRARFSMNRVKGVGGSSGTKSSGTRRVSSSADDNSMK
jgi:hypothetical protein